MIAVDLNSGVPAYRQIVEQVRFLVASGTLAAGDELPSTRLLSEELGLNPMTVSKAYSQLEQERLVERRPGLPLRVRAHDSTTRTTARAEQMQAVLAPAALAARQLGLSTAEALRAFRLALQQHDANQEHDR